MSQSRGCRVRILLIAEQQTEFRLIEYLLANMVGEQHQLSWCQDDPKVLAATAATDYALIIWGDIKNPRNGQALLAELNRQNSKAPIIIVVDSLPNNVDMEAVQSGYSDILCRDSISSPVLSRSICFVLERARKESQSSNGQLTDALTGLNNRQTFHDYLQKLLAKATTADTLALVLIDIDGFKKINDSYGQGAGDVLIQLSAECIQSCLPAGQALARTGGNEFGLVFCQTPEFANNAESIEEECIKRLEKIKQRMSEPFAIGQNSIRVDCSIGVALNSDIAISVDDLMSNADLAMRHAKKQEGSAYQFHTPSLLDDTKKMLRMEAEIRRALRNEEFVLHYQPRIELASDRIVGMEGLIRWQHPSKGMLPPGEFIHVAEETGLIVPLGYWVIHQACEDLRTITDNGDNELRVAVNLSFRQFQDDRFVPTINNIIQKHHVDASRLEFELTETTMMIDGETVGRHLLEISKLGVHISLDDFGTGYSSFAHIQRLPISALKVDRSFVNNVVTNADDATIVKAIINLAHSLNLMVIAEGAETKEQVEFLRENNCDQVQGYYFFKPIPFVEVCQRISQGVAMTIPLLAPFS